MEMVIASLTNHAHQAFKLMTMMKAAHAGLRLKTLSTKLTSSRRPTASQTVLKVSTLTIFHLDASQIQNVQTAFTMSMVSASKP